MRNLKRVLSLVLACTMLLGMMVVGASAADKTYADLTDSADIKNKEAVSLLVDLGIIEGTGDGSYKPEVTVDRASMAKLITVMMMGDVDQDSFKGTVTDLGDIDGHWAEGYIKFCYSNKIISGDGKGHFYPNEPVTVVQAAKMLLVATGYDSKDRGYEGDNWTVNVMRDSNSALEYGKSTVRSLTKGISVKASDPLTRDNAAQMIFNTLFVRNVEANKTYDMGQEYIASYNTKPSFASSRYDNLTRHTAILDKVDVANGTVDLHTATTDRAAMALTGETADVGSFVVYYTHGTAETDPLATSSVVATNVDPIATTSDGIPYTSLINKDDDNYIGVEPDGTPRVYYNGTKLTASGIAALNTAKTGIVVDFIDIDANGKYDTVKVTEYFLSQVTRVTPAKGDAKASVTIPGLGTVSESKLVGSFADLASGDYVMCAKIGDLFYVYEPTAITGSMTRYNMSKQTMTIDGTAYTWATLNNQTSLTSAADFVTGSSNGQSTFYLDKNNYVVAVAGAKTEKKYAVVDSIAYVATAGVTGTGYAEARLVFSDGSTAIVNIGTIDSKAPVSKVTDGSKEFELKADREDAKNVAFVGNMYSYTVDSDSDYHLTTVDAKVGSAKIQNGVASIVGSEPIATANDSTVYVYKTGNGKFVTYKGYKNAPTTQQVSGADVAVISAATSAAGYATFVYVDVNGASIGDVETNLIVFLSQSADVDNSGSSPIYNYTAALNGEVGTYSSKKALTFGTKTLYFVNVDNDGYISATEPDGVDFTAGDNTAISTSFTYTMAADDANDGALKVSTAVNGAKTLTYSGSETVYLISGSDVLPGKASDIKAGTYFWVQTVDTTTPAGKVAMKLVYVLDPAVNAIADAPATMQVTATGATVTAADASNAGKDLVKGAVSLTSAAKDHTVTVTAAAVTNGYVTVTISGKGTAVEKTADGASCAATYTLVEGDLGNNLTVTVTCWQAGKTAYTHTYTIAVVKA